MLVLTLAPGVSLGPFNSSIEGTLTDPSAAVIPQAQVTLHFVQTGVDTKSMTNNAGFYRFSDIGPGDYQVIAKGKDFVFSSLLKEGKVPINACSFVKDHLRPASRASGVKIADGQRYGLHNLHHSLSNWLVNKSKVESRTVQGLLRLSKRQTTLDLYTQEDGDETRAAQAAFLNAVGVQGRMIQ